MNLKTPVASSINDSCKRLGLGRTTVYELIAAGKLRTFKVGNKTLIPESELHRFVAASMEATPA